MSTKLNLVATTGPSMQAVLDKAKELAKPFFGELEPQQYLDVLEPQDLTNWRLVADCDHLHNEEGTDFCAASLYVMVRKEPDQSQ